MFQKAHLNSCTRKDGYLKLCNRSLSDGFILKNMSVLERKINLTVKYVMQSFQLESQYWLIKEFILKKKNRMNVKHLTKKNFSLDYLKLHEQSYAGEKNICRGNIQKAFLIV